MRTPEFRPLAREDFTEAPWIEKLLRPLNSFLTQVRAGLQNGLTLSENLNAEVKTLDVTAKDDWVAISLTSPYTAGSPAPAYRKVGRRVSFRGVLTLNTAVSGNAWASLPASVRPDISVAYAVPGGAAGEFLRVAVNTAGSATLAWSGAPATCSLDGISYDAVDDDGINPAFPISFKTKVRGRAAGLIVLRVVELSGRDEIVVGSAVTVGWSQDAASVQLKGLTGLVPGKKYRVTMLVVGS